MTAPIIPLSSFRYRGEHAKRIADGAYLTRERLEDFTATDRLPYAGRFVRRRVVAGLSEIHDGCERLLDDLDFLRAREGFVFTEDLKRIQAKVAAAIARIEHDEETHGQELV